MLQLQCYINCTGALIEFAIRKPDKARSLLCVCVCVRVSLYNYSCQFTWFIESVLKYENAFNIPDTTWIKHYSTLNA